MTNPSRVQAAIQAIRARASKVGQALKSLWRSIRTRFPGIRGQRDNAQMPAAGEAPPETPSAAVTSAPQTGPTIRKAGLKWKYSLDDAPRSLLQADSANTLAIVVGVGAVPLLRSISAPYWISGLVVGAIPLFMSFLRGHHLRSRPNSKPLDVLTITTFLVGIFVTTSAFAATVLTVTDRQGHLWAADVAGYLALPVCFLGEAFNTYTIVIKKPIKAAARLSLFKSIFLMISVSLILLYLLIVRFGANLDIGGLPRIDFSTASYLFWAASVAAVPGLLVGAGRLLLNRTRTKQSSPATT